MGGKYRYSTYAILIAVGLIFLALFFFDYLAAVTLYWPVVIIALVIGTLLLFLQWKITNQWTTLGAIVIFCLAVLCLHATDLNPRKPFKRFYKNLVIGSTQKDVLDSLVMNFPEGGRFRRPSIVHIDDNSVSLVLDPLDGRYNSEAVSVLFDHGRLTNKNYGMD